MKLMYLFIFLLVGCSVKENYVNEDRAFGLYKRDWRGQVEYICLKKDYTYEYVSKEKGDVITESWEFEENSGRSAVTLYGFSSYSKVLNKYSESITQGVLVKYSHAKDAILLRFDADDHFRDFIRIDSISNNVPND